MNLYKTASLVFILSVGLIVNGQTKDSLEVITATQKFLRSFNTFDWKKFSQSFTNDATIFFPDWQEGIRRIGKKSIEETWLAIFPEFLDSANTFKMDIIPKDIFLQLYRKTAIVTFHLGDQNGELSRRTFVWVKQKKQWRIAHLHASNVSPGRNN